MPGDMPSTAKEMLLTEVVKLVVVDEPAASDTQQCGKPSEYIRIVFAYMKGKTRMNRPSNGSTVPRLHFMGDFINF